MIPRVVRAAVVVVIKVRVEVGDEAETAAAVLQP
jgi:hypothetical protein